MQGKICSKENIVIIVFILMGFSDNQTMKHTLHCYNLSIHKTIQADASLKNDLEYLYLCWYLKMKKLDNGVRDKKELESMCH